MKTKGLVSFEKSGAKRLAEKKSWYSWGHFPVEKPSISNRGHGVQNLSPENENSQFYLHENRKTKWFTYQWLRVSLALKQRLGATRKWRIWKVNSLSIWICPLIYLVCPQHFAFVLSSFPRWKNVFKFPREIKRKVMQNGKQGWFIGGMQMGEFSSFSR